MKRSKRKQEIYTAAVHLFKEKGYTAASMRDLAVKVGIEASSLYSHISSKEEILRDICMECSSMFELGMAHIKSVSGTHLEKIKLLIKLHMDIALNHPSSVTVFNDEWKHLPAHDLKLFLNSRRNYEKDFREILQNGIQAEEFSRRSSSVLFNIIINSTKWLHYYPKKMTDEEMEKIKSDIFSFLEAGLTSTNE